ncbi:hypothetical protein [Dactylosporangium sp. CS-033363]|uniref:hypothetical protein n=1 Tax=Dactylosporangium sp. CS-033363 TaxID=3239935 RepID=UPI003D8DBFF6
MSTPTGDEPTVPQRVIDAVRRIGAHAAARGRPISSCPYDPEGDARQRVLAHAFVTGHQQRRPPEHVDFTPDAAAGELEG